MPDSLAELLLTNTHPASLDPSGSVNNGNIYSEYLAHLSSLPLSSLTSSEVHSLSQSSHSLLLALQALSTRSYKPIINSLDYLSTLPGSIQDLSDEVEILRSAIPALDKAALQFSKKYAKNTENTLLARRKKAMLLARNVDRVSDILDLPSLLSTAISSSTISPGPTGTATGSVYSSNTAGYASALDLYSYARRLQTLYPQSPLITGIVKQAEEAMQRMTTNLILSLRAPGVKLAATMRTIGWLKRVVPALEGAGGIGTLFLTCRLENLVSTLEALDPLKELADQECQVQASKNTTKDSNASVTRESVSFGGQHTERYLKRYIEIFREQSFGIISMYRSIFPSSTAGAVDNPSLKPSALASRTKTNDKTYRKVPADDSDPLPSSPSVPSTFTLHLVDLLRRTLEKYLPNVQENGARESLLTQVLYCASSLGRLGGDFGLLLATMPLGSGSQRRNNDSDDSDTGVWAEVMKKHRVLAGRLELLATGMGAHDTS